MKGVIICTDLQFVLGRVIIPTVSVFKTVYLTYYQGVITYRLGLLPDSVVKLLSLAKDSHLHFIIMSLKSNYYVMSPM